MNTNFLWSVCCITEAGGNWNLGALPSYQGKVTAPLNADTFRITKASKHPDQAFEFLRFLVQGEGKTKMLNAISGFPALKADQASFFDRSSSSRRTTRARTSTRPASTGTSSRRRSSTPTSTTNTESPMPNYNKSLDVLVKYLTRFTGTSGLNVDAELDKMKSELQRHSTSRPNDPGSPPARRGAAGPRRSRTPHDRHPAAASAPAPPTLVAARPRGGEAGG